MATTFVAIKPDGIRKKAIGNIISRFERVGFNLKAIKIMQVTREMAEEHYQEHKGKPFFERLVNYITSAPIIAMAWECQYDDIIQIVRKIAGATNPADAQPGTIRGDFANNMNENVVHSSDSLASAERELKIFFPELFGSAQ